MNKTIDIDKKFEQVIGKSAISKAEDISVFKESDSSYILFNAYLITKNTNGYLVSTKNTHTVNIFYLLKNAVSWCVNDKRNKIIQAKRILELDQRLCGMDAQVQLHKKLFKTAKNTESKLIYIAKLNEDKIKKYNIINELQKYIDESCEWQQKRFNSNSL